MIAFPADMSGTPLVPVGVTIHGTDPTVQKVASYDELAQCLRARTPGNIDNSSTTVVQQPVAYGIRTANTSSNGWGIQEEVTHTLDCAQGVAVAETLYTQGIKQGVNDARPQETNPGALLRTLLNEVGAETFTQWGLGIFDSLQPSEILRRKVYGCGVRPAAFSRSWVVHCALSRPEDGSAWLLQSLREAGCEGCASQGLEPFEQLARQLRAYLSELSHPGAQAARFLHDLWQAAEGVGLLREALSALQEVGRPAARQNEPAQPTYRVRRLIPVETEFLQGFPRGYTAIPKAKDGPRYKALGNSMAVPVMRWIGRSIDYAMIWSTP